MAVKEHFLPGTYNSKVLIVSNLEGKSIKIDILRGRVKQGKQGNLGQGAPIIRRPRVGQKRCQPQAAHIIFVSVVSMN